jgi:hypothetical protein
MRIFAGHQHEWYRVRGVRRVRAAGLGVYHLFAIPVVGGDK